MAAIVCGDYFEGIPGLIPSRPKRTNPDAIENRWANFVYSMDLSPTPEDDELGNAYGAWSLWDLPVSHAAQIDDDRGDDLITVAILNRVYVLDWTRFRDEWGWNAYKPIYRMMRLGPIPASKDDTEGGDAYRLDHVKRFRELLFNVKDGATALMPATDISSSKWRITVAEWDNEDATFRRGMREGARRVRFQTAVRGQSFVVTLEHAANEQTRIDYWQAQWDILGPRIRTNRKTL